MLLQDTLIHLGLALPVPFESVAVAARGEDLARFKAAPGYASELNRFHATLKVARGVVEQQKREETMAVPAQGLRDILSKIQELEDEVSAMLGSKSTGGPVGDSQDTSSGSSAKKPSTSPDEQHGPGGQGMPLSQPPGKGSAPVSDAVGSGSAAVPTAASSTKSSEEDDCAPEHLIYALGGASLQTRSHVSDHPLFRRNTNCTLGSVADHAQRLHKGSPLKKPASGQTQDGGSDSASAADTSSGPSSENPSSGKAQDAGDSADAVSPPPSASAAELQQSKPSTKPEPMPEGVPDVTPVPLDDSTSPPTDNQPDSDTTAAQPGADTGAPSSVPANTDVTLDGVDIPVSTIDALSSSAAVMGETADGALEATTPAIAITPEESELSTITLTSTRTRQSTKTMTITQTTTVRVSRASATANAKNKDSAVASAITYEKFKNGTVYAKFSNGTIVGGVSNDTLTTPSIGKFDNSTAIPELQSVDGTTPTLSMTEALKPSQIAVDGPLYNITDTVSISSDDGMTSPLTPTSMKMLQTSSEALLNATSSTSSPSNNAKATATSLNDSKAKERVKPVSDDSVLQSADSATPSPTPEASSALKASHASSHEHLSNATDSTSVRAKMLPASSASESSSPKVSKTSALERLVDLEHSASLHSIDDATPTSSPEMMVSSTPKDTQAMHTSVSAHVKAATHGSSKSPSNSASSPASGATTSLNSPTSSVGTSSLPKTPASVSQTKAFSNTTTNSYPPVDKVIHPPASLQGHLKKNQHPEVTPVPLSKNPRHVLNGVAKMTGPSGFKTVTNRRARN